MSRFIVIALALFLSSSAGAEEGRRHHRRGASPSSVGWTSPFEADGVLERGADGGLLLALPISEETRAHIAAARGVAAEEVPATVRRRLHPAPTGPTALEIESTLGRRTRAVLAQDSTGQTFLVALRSPVEP